MVARGGKKPPRGPTRPGLCNTHFVGKRINHYLEVLQATGEKVLARKEVGVSIEAVNSRRERYQDFNDREDEALNLYRASLAQEVHRRGVDGVKDPIFWQGAIVGYKIVYSDKLLLAQVERHIPEYRRSLQINQKTEVTTTPTLAGLKELPLDELEIYEEYVAKIQALRKKKKEA